MKFLSIAPLGTHQGNPRLWIESRRLEGLGFPPGTPLRIEPATNEVFITPAILGNNHVSSRRIAGGRRPIIDVADRTLLRPLADFSELRIQGSHQRLQIRASHRAAAILRARQLTAPLRVLEVFSGGGTMSAALNADTRFMLKAGIEIEPVFADVWQSNHPEAALIQADLRRVPVSDLPEFDLLIGGIPCTSHSNLGRAKHGLAGKPELGDAGDLFLPVLGVVRERMPSAVLFENVPAFANSLAGQLLETHLRRLGYHVVTAIVQPNAEWGELEDRVRWLLVATLDRPFALQSPGQKCGRNLAEFLDAPDAIRDAEDAGRISRTTAGLERHRDRHAALGHGFNFTVLNGSETRIPVIPKSYANINTGPFVQTSAGPRLLRLPEIERIRGYRTRTQDYATGTQILGQGVQTRVFSTIFSQLADHLLPVEPKASGCS